MKKAKEKRRLGPARRQKKREELGTAGEKAKKKKKKAPDVWGLMTRGGIIAALFFQANISGGEA